MRDNDRKASLVATADGWPAPASARRETMFDMTAPQSDELATAETRAEPDSRPWSKRHWPWWRQECFIPTVVEALIIGGLFWGFGDWRENQRAEHAEQLEDQRAERADKRTPSR